MNNESILSSEEILLYLKEMFISFLTEREHEILNYHIGILKLPYNTIAHFEKVAPEITQLGFLLGTNKEFFKEQRFNKEEIKEIQKKLSKYEKYLARLIKFKRALIDFFPQL